MKQKIVFIGNSIVNGFPMNRGRSFPGLIRAAVKAGDTSFHADVINKGINGETTAEILDRFEHDVLDHEPAAVFIMTGTNDFIYREADPAGCMENLKVMAQQAMAEGITVVYITPLPVHAEKASRMWMAGVGVDYEEINGQIADFAGRIRESGQLFIDAGAAWKEYSLPLGESAWLDGVHPTPEGYQFLAETVLAWMEEHAGELGLK